MDNIEKLIGERVRVLRLKLKLSQETLAKNAKTSLTTINRLEKGRQFPHSNTLTDIAKALGVTVSALYADPNSETQESNLGNGRAARLVRIQERLFKLNDRQLEDLEDSIQHLENPIGANNVENHKKTKD